MTRLELPRIGAIAIALLVATTGAFGQDVAAVNPNTIKVKLDNERVRVMEATLPPGAKEHLHHHPRSIVYVMAGGKVRNHAADGKTNDVTYTAGDTLYREPVTHWAENVGTTTIRMIVIELKGQ
jgi:quercetin dioxygenase-like cupin family protein